jgi:hypothetical protein
MTKGTLGVKPLLVRSHNETRRKVRLIKKPSFRRGFAASVRSLISSADSINAAPMREPKVVTTTTSSWRSSRALLQFPTNDGLRYAAYCSIAASINDATITKPTAVATTVKGSSICSLPIGHNPPKQL